MFIRNSSLIFFVIILILATVVPFPTASVAQDGDVEWHFALSRNQLVAYTLDGEVNVLHEGEGLLSRISYRFEDNNALIHLEDGDTNTYYHVSPDSIDEIPIDPERTWLPMAGTERFLVLHGAFEPGRFAPNILYDVQNRQLHELQGVSNWPNQNRCCGFSADGTILRYVSFPAEDSVEWSIIERNLETGEEREFFTPNFDPTDAEPRNFNILTDSHGERWFWRYVNRDNDIDSANLVDADGTNEVLGTYEATPETFFLFLGNYLAEFTIACQNDCTLRVFLDDDEEVILQSTGDVPSDLIRLKEGGFLGVYRGTDYFVLNEDTPPQSIGFYSPLYVFSPYYISPDGRWYTLFDEADEPTMLVVWDAATQERVYEYRLPEDEGFFLSTVYFSSAGQIVYSNVGIQDMFVALDYASGTTTTLPVVEDEVRIYFELLADGSVLVARISRDVTEVEGIWRYDPASDTFSPILTGARWRPIRFLNND